VDLAVLLELQRIDSDIDRSTIQRPRLAEIASHGEAERELARVRAEVARVSGAQSSALGELDRIEARSADLDAHRERLERQLRTVIAPREAEALQNEMAGLAAQRNELDDRGLELLEASSAADEELAGLAAAEQVAGRAVEVAATVRQNAEAAADLRLAELRALRDVTAGRIDAADLARYERHRAGNGGVAVAALDRGTCGACHVSLSVSELDTVKRSTDTPECPHCARWLVR
jgi:predicted  nucleic acid-binding Zn-ribbon protein